MSLQSLSQLKDEAVASRLPTTVPTVRGLRRAVALSTDRRGPHAKSYLYSMKLSWNLDIGNECGLVEGCRVDVMFDRENYKCVIRLANGIGGRKVYKIGARFLIMCPMAPGLPSAAQPVICPHAIGDGVLTLDIPRCVSFDLNLREEVAPEATTPLPPSVPPALTARIFKAIASRFWPAV